MSQATDLAERDPENTHCRRHIGIGFLGGSRFCGEPVSVPGALYCEACGGPAAGEALRPFPRHRPVENGPPASGPREAGPCPIKGSRLSSPLPSPGDRQFTISKRDLIEALVDPLTETVWVAVQRDDRAYADLLLEVAEKLLEDSERHRKKAIRKTRDKRCS